MEGNNERPPTVAEVLGIESAPSEVFIIMSNDYPAGALTDEAQAEAVVDRFNREQKQKAGVHGQRVYWRYYAFDIGDLNGAESFHAQIMHSLGR